MAVDAVVKMESPKMGHRTMDHSGFHVQYQWLIKLSGGNGVDLVGFSDTRLTSCNHQPESRDDEGQASPSLPQLSLGSGMVTPVGAITIQHQPWSTRCVASSSFLSRGTGGWHRALSTSGISVPIGWPNILANILRKVI